MKNNELQHLNPAWKERADFVIGAKVKDLTWSKTYPYEQLAVAD